MMWLVDHVGFGIDTDRTDISYRIFNDYFDLPIHAEAEVIVEYKYAVEAVQTLRDLVVENEYPVNYITEVSIALTMYSCTSVCIYLCIYEILGKPLFMCMEISCLYMCVHAVEMNKLLMLLHE